MYQTMIILVVLAAILKESSSHPTPGKYQTISNQNKRKKSEFEKTHRTKKITSLKCFCFAEYDNETCLDLEMDKFRCDQMSDVPCYLWCDNFTDCRDGQDEIFCKEWKKYRNQIQGKN